MLTIGLPTDRLLIDGYPYFVLRLLGMAPSGRLLRAVIMGPPGAGKGTIAKRIVKDFGLTHLASGDILRRQVVNRTEVGLLANKYIGNGDLVPDNVMMKLVLTELRGRALLRWLLLD